MARLGNNDLQALFKYLTINIVQFLLQFLSEI